MAQEHIVWLSEDTIQRIYAIASYRQWQKRGRGQVNQKISKQDALTTEISGLKGEFGVAQYYGLEPNLGLEADKGWDLIINGKTVDVKYTGLWYGDLFFTDATHFKAEVALLATAVGTTGVELKGWIERERFLVECLKHPPRKYGEKAKSWMGLGMTQPDVGPRECDICEYHYAPINPMKSREV